jgi:uncharacterized membrane protein YhaH (DUF805 family)
MEWMILPLRRYAQFSGRSRRKEYWMFALFNVLVASALVALGGMLFGLDAAQLEETPAGLGFFATSAGMLLGLYGLAVLVPSIAVTVRRLHDRNMSGWWYLLFAAGGLVPVVGVIISLGFLVLMALPGSSGANRFGPDPTAAADGEVGA